MSRSNAMRLLGAALSSPNINPCHNGITTDGIYYYGIDTTALYKYDKNWNVVAHNSSASTQANVSHLGDGQYYNGYIYTAAENYVSPVSYSSMRIARFNASDLSFYDQYSTATEGNETSGLCIDAVNNIIYVCSFVQSNAIYKYRLSDFTYLGSIPLTQTLVQVQGIAYNNGHLYLAEGSTSKVYKVSLSGVVGDWINVCSNGSVEGIDYSYNNTLLVLDENSPTTTTIIRIVPEVAARLSLQGNLVRNGDFELRPSFIAPTTATKVWIDGTAAGQTRGDNYFGWGTNKPTTGSEVQYDTTTYHSGTGSMKLSITTAGGRAEVAPYMDDTVSSNHARYSIPVRPNRDYTLIFWMKTNYVSGDSADGALVALRQFDRSGVQTTATNSTKVKTTTGWTQYTMNITTLSTTFYLAPRLTLYGHTGAATLVMDAWFDDIDIRLTSSPARVGA